MKTKRDADDFQTVATGPGVRLYRGADAAQALRRAQQELGQVEVLQGRHLRRGGIGGLFAEDLGVEIAVRQLIPGSRTVNSAPRDKPAQTPRVIPHPSDDHGYDHGTDDDALVELVRELLRSDPHREPAHETVQAPDQALMHTPSKPRGVSVGSFADALARAGVPIETFTTDHPTGQVLTGEIAGSDWDGLTAHTDRVAADRDANSDQPDWQNSSQPVADVTPSYDERYQQEPGWVRDGAVGFTDDVPGQMLDEAATVNQRTTTQSSWSVPAASRIYDHSAEDDAPTPARTTAPATQTTGPNEYPRAAEATWGPVRSAKARRLVTTEELTNLGVAPHLAWDCMDVGELTALMRSMTPGLAMTPPRGVSAVVGPLDAAWSIADQLFDRVVVLERPPVRGVKPLQEAMLRQLPRPGSTAVVIGAGELPADDEALRKVISTIRPIEVRVVVDASWSEMRMWRAAQVPGRLVMDLMNLNSTGRPCTALRVGIPVVSLDGKPADERAWTELVLRRLGRI
jgi:hypothetical protein